MVFIALGFRQPVEGKRGERVPTCVTRGISLIITPRRFVRSFVPPVFITSECLYLGSALRIDSAEPFAGLLFVGKSGDLMPGLRGVDNRERMGVVGGWEALLIDLGLVEGA